MIRSGDRNADHTRRFSYLMAFRNSDQHREALELYEQIKMRAEKAMAKETDSNVIVRNLSVISTDALTSDQVHGYFEQFGEIEQVQWHQMNLAHYGFVQFKLEESAKAVLSQSNHRIGDVVPSVTAADDSLQPDFELILRTLDDDSLKEVLLRLKLGDLSNAADTCVRFKNAANWAFIEKFKWLDFDRIRMNDYIFTIRDDDSVMEKLFENVLRNFGSLIHSLGMIKNEKTLELVSRYCVDKFNLKELDFCRVHITKEVAEKFRSVFKQINKLGIRGTTFDENISHLFPLCTKLTDLWFWSSCSDSNAKSVLNNLLISNPKLTKLTIYMRNTVINSHNAFERYLRAPSELKIGFDYQYLSNLSMLNELSLDFGYQIVSPVLKSLVERNVPIKQLSLSNGVMYHDAFESICQMKQLNRLDLRSIFSIDLDETHLVEWAKHLPELQELWFDKCTIRANEDALKGMISYARKLKFVQIGMQPGTKIELSDYKTMLEIVKSQAVQTYLQIKMVGGNVDVPEDIRTKNRTWFDIHAVKMPDWIIGFSLRIDPR